VVAVVVVEMILEPAEQVVRVRHTRLCFLSHPVISLMFLWVVAESAVRVQPEAQVVVPLAQAT
jgi:hypothetical protein